MARTHVLAATITFVVACGSADQRSCTGTGSAVRRSEAPPPEAAKADASTPARGRLFYELYCSLCHGRKGEGYVADNAPALANQQFLVTASDDYLRRAISRGRPGTTMSAWSVARGGPLLDADVGAIVAYLRTWQNEVAAPVDDRRVSGDALRGARTYAVSCASCHGADGTGGRYSSLANAEFLAGASDGYIAAAIERGRPGTPMAAWSNLSPSEVGDLTQLLRSWQRPVGAPPPLPPKPGGLRDIVINPSGPAPDFDAKADFVSVEQVKLAIDRGARVVIIDARAPSDYSEMHIAGAVSVPFYLVEAYAAELPKTSFILTYCACPHAESTLARDGLRALGFKRVAVIDEGSPGWRDRGYPMRGGAQP